MTKIYFVFLVSVFLLVACEDAQKKRQTGIEKNRKIVKDQMKSTKPVKPEKSVLNSMFAGSWYPKDKSELKKELQGYLDNVKVKKINNVIALILPHAGYRFSGQTAMYGIAEIKGKSFDKIIILGPSHRHYMHNKVSIPDVTHYGTPLGESELDLHSIAELRKSPYVTNMGKEHYSEHSVQMEIPLIQFGLKNVKIIPVVCGDLDAETSKNVASALLQVTTPETLVIVSSDFLHYGRNFQYIPFKDNIQENIRKVDMGAYEQIRRISSDGFSKYCESSKATICGRNAIGILLHMLPEKTEATLLKYDTSGRIMSDFSNSVSYMSIAFAGKWTTNNKGSKPKLRKASSGLNEEEKKSLLKLARETINYYLKKQKIPSSEELSITITPAMKKKMGVFVTLHKNGKLRGCIGEIIATRPLYRAVLERAVSSAFNDHRFRPLRGEELDKIDIEISALTPPEEIASWKDIVIGKHGVILKKNGMSAVFLPQVAPEQGWDVETTLTYLSRKAGLKPDGWKEGAKIFVFEADVFGE